MNDGYNEVLQEVELPQISQDKCRADLGHVSITDNMLCMGVEEGGRGTCSRDSGSPAMYKNRLLGIVSFCDGCSQAHLPTILTRVTKYVLWIQKHIASA